MHTLLLHAGIERDIFDKDWARVTQKGRFMKLLQKHCPEAEQVDALRGLLKARYNYMVHIFDFYAALGAGDPFAMHLGAWGMLVLDAQIAGARMHACMQRRACIHACTQPSWGQGR